MNVSFQEDLPAVSSRQRVFVNGGTLIMCDGI
jgi:hypothetical protein